MLNTKRTMTTNWMKQGLNQLAILDGKENIEIEITMINVREILVNIQRTPIKQMINNIFMTIT